jgi:hypothetical protein
MNLKNYAFVALAVVGLAACKKNNSNNPEQQSTGEDTKISLSLSIASSGAKTYAPEQDGDVNATADDIRMKTVDIFIYDKESPFALLHKQLKDVGNGSANFEPDLDNEGNPKRLKNGIVLDAKTGDKLIYVGVNLPASMVTKIKATQGPASIDEVFNATELTVEPYQELNWVNGMAMFTNEGIVTTLEKAEGGVIPSANKITFELTRMLAKVTVGGTDAFKNKIAYAQQNTNRLIPVLGGSIHIDYLSYSLKQMNKSTYLKGNQVIPWIPNNDFFANFGLVANFGASMKYTTENLSDNDLAKQTFALLHTRFIPEVFVDEADYTYSEGADFYTVTDPLNGSVNYFINEANARENASDKELRKYESGFCYYHIYLNPNNDHKVVRNEFYQVKVSNIRGIGKSSQQAAIEAGGKLYNSELIDRFTGGFTTLYKPQPAITNTNIEASVTIVPWNVVASEYEL